MRYQLAFHSAFLSDLCAVKCQQEARRPGLGKKFEDQVYHSIAEVRLAPTMHGVVFSNLRRVRIPGFKFGVVYRIAADRVEVFGLHHDREDLKKFAQRQMD